MAEKLAEETDWSGRQHLLNSTFACPGSLIIF
jgi:hypothetical protein